MRLFAIAALALASVGTVYAAEDAAIAPAAAGAVAKNGDMLRDAALGRIGPVTRVMADGSVQVIVDSRFVVIPANTLTSEDGKLKTSLTRKEVRKLK